MPYTLEQFSADIRSELSADSSPAGQARILEFVTKALLDDDFIEQHLQANVCKPRKVLFEDSELGFCICGHVYEEGMTKVWPHDHGPTWAIYGLAGGETEMTDWKIVKQGDDTNATLVEPTRKYEMKRGDCYLYKTGDVHSPVIGVDAKLIRVEGENLDHVKRSNIKAA